MANTRKPLLHHKAYECKNCGSSFHSGIIAKLDRNSTGIVRFFLECSRCGTANDEFVYNDLNRELQELFEPLLSFAVDIARNGTTDHTQADALRVLKMLGQKVPSPPHTHKEKQ